MRIRAIAWNTFGSLLHNRLLLLIVLLFLSWVALMTAPLIMMKHTTTTANAGRMQSEVLGMVSLVMAGLSGFGSMLAAWCAADSVASEMKSGTILAVMARPVERWEFLLGKFGGVQLLLVVYVFGMLALSHVFAWIGGQRIHAPLWELVAYPLVRYAIYSAVALLLVTFLNQAVSLAVVWCLAIATSIINPMEQSKHKLLEWGTKALYFVLPSTELLSETRFLTITETSLKRTGWLDHVVTLAYGLDYAAVLILLALWSFRRKSLTRD